MKTHPASSAAGVLAALALLLVPVDAKPGGGNGGGNDKGGGGGGAEKGDKGNKGNKGGGADKGNKGNKGGGKGDKEKGADKAAKNDNKPDKDMSDKGNKGNNGNKGDKPDKGADFSIERAPRFKDEERGAILGYFSRHKDNDGGLPPGLAKNLRRGKPLPPGWQDKVAAGYRIEDDYWDSFTPVPYDWFPELRPEPDYALYYYGDRIVRVYEPRRTVVEVIIVPTIRF